MTRSRLWLLALGAALVLLGFFLPRGWYDALPTAIEGLPDPPIKGVTLLQITFVLDGVILLWLSTRRLQFRQLAADERLAVSAVQPDPLGLTPRSAAWLLAGITALGLVLRLIRLNSDLWLDEITPIMMYADMPVLQIVTSYVNSNNHLINSLLIKAMVGVFGEQEWAVRVPAMLFGVATIPALYWVARLALSRVGSLCAALLLATSYHHIFFSQNARGYSAYLLFSVLSSGLLVKGLQEDRWRDWVLYTLTMFLNLAALLNSGFVLASHMIVGALALFIVWRSGRSPLPLFRRLTAVLVATGLLVFNLYVTILPQVYVYSRTIYSHAATGFSPLSAEFIMELARGIGAGFGTGVLLGAVPFLLIGALGFVMLLRRQWALMAALVLPEVLTAVFLLAQNLTFSPRFFLLALPLAMIVAVEAIFAVTGAVADQLKRNAPRPTQQAAIGLVMVATLISLASLRYYYSTPKQPYRASLVFALAHRASGDPIIALHLMEKGYRFYGKRFNLQENTDWFSVRSNDALDAVLASHPGSHPVLVMTFPRALRLTDPNLYMRIREQWERVQGFPATVGDGDISVWRQRETAIRQSQN